MGFVEARIATAALLEHEAAVHRCERVNEAFAGVKNFQTDILCSPWYFGKIPRHVPNNVDRTTTPKNGKMVDRGGLLQDLRRRPGYRQGSPARAAEPEADQGQAVPAQG